MGKKGKWFGGLKKVFSPESKEKKHEGSANLPSACGRPGSSATPLECPPPPPAPTPEETTLPLLDQGQEQSKCVDAQVSPTSALPAPPAATQPLLSLPVGASREEFAAIKIQTAFRGYLARRALRALKGLVRLKSLIEGNSVKRQVASTLRCMQTLARVQAQIRTRRIKMTKENQALQRQLLLKQELESLRMGEEWDDSLQSKEQIEASLVNRQEAALRRERALAYAFSHQWKNNARSMDPVFIDLNNPQWGWSWLERWMAVKPVAAEKETNADRASVKAINGVNPEGGELTKANDSRDSKPSKPPSPSAAKVITVDRQASAGALTVNNSSPRATKKKVSATNTPPTYNGFKQLEDDTRSVLSSIQAERPRRHSVAGSSVRDDESIAGGSPVVPSYMAPTRSARAKSRFESASDQQQVYESTMPQEKAASVGSIKKRLSFPGPSPGVMVRRLSGPPKVVGQPEGREVVGDESK